MTVSLRDPDQSDTRGDASRLPGRAAERARLDRLLESAAAGRAAALRVLGDRGLGKSTLLDYLASQAASDPRVLRVRGVASERELPYAGLQLLCAPLLEEMDDLEPAQRAALSTAIGLSASGPPDRFLVSIAVLNLLTGVARQGRLCCLVDDAHWLDRASLLVLAFVARRAEHCGLLVIFGELDQQDVTELDGLPEMRLGALTHSDAESMLSAATPGKLDPAVRERMLLEARGNPRALLEGVEGITAGDLAGGYAIPAPRPDRRHRDHDCERRAQRLPAAAQRLLLTAAAEPTGDPALVWRASDWLGIGPEAADALEAEHLLTLAPRVVFGCGRLRTALYTEAPPAERRLVHRALAEAVTGGEADRRAWHLALSTSGLDDRIARGLEHSAAAAQARGGTAARAAFLERAALLSADPATRSRLALTAAGAKRATGSLDTARQLLVLAESGPADPARTAQIELERARIAFTTRRDESPSRLLLDAAHRLRPHSADLARHAHLEALAAAVLCSDDCHDPAESQLRKAAEAARDRAACGPITSMDLLLDALVARVLGGPGRAATAVRAALTGLGDAGADSTARGWSWLAGWIAADAWDEQAWAVLVSRGDEERSDEGGAGPEMSDRSQAPVQSALLDVHRGRFDTAHATLSREHARTTGPAAGPSAGGALVLAAWQGRLDILRGALPEARRRAHQRGDALTVTATQLAEAVLHNGAGHYEQAMAAARDAADSDRLALAGWACAELVEAAVRCGHREVAVAALERLDEQADAAATPWARGVRAAAQALLTEQPDAESHYQEAIDQLSKTGIRVHLARAQLLYGEWLRRENRRIDARVLLRDARQQFATMGAAGFEARASAELLATGERSRRRTVETDRQLTPQETRIGYLARDGLSNSQIGARLFVSPRTVEYHLHKVFAKLGITSRTELHLVLSPGGDVPGVTGPDGRGDRVR